MKDDLPATAQLTHPGKGFAGILRLGIGQLVIGDASPLFLDSVTLRTVKKLPFGWIFTFNMAGIVDNVLYFVDNLSFGGHSATSG